jgi:hypothetical protein
VFLLSVKKKKLYKKEMYSDYRRLFAMGCSPSTGITDSTRFSCGSIPYQTMVRKSIQDPQMYDVDNGNQCIDQCAKETEACAYKCSSGDSNSDVKPMKVLKHFLRKWLKTIYWE